MWRLHPACALWKIAITCSYPFYGFPWQFLLAQYIWSSHPPTSHFHMIWTPNVGPQMNRSPFGGPSSCVFFLDLVEPPKSEKGFIFPCTTKKSHTWSQIMNLTGRKSPAVSMSIHYIVLFKIVSQPPQVFDDWKNITRSLRYTCGPPGIRIGHGHSQAGQETEYQRRPWNKRRFNWQKMRVLPSNNMHKSIQRWGNMNCASWSKWGSSKY